MGACSVIKKTSKKYAIFGAGELGKAAYRVLHQKNDCICWVDNDTNKHGTAIFGLPVVGFEEWLQTYKNTTLMIALNSINRQEVIKILLNRGISNYEIFNREMLYYRERVVSYAHPAAMEDLILYHVFHDIDGFFYIDVGCNDPVVHSVTKLFYDRGAHGINIDPIKEYIDMYELERKRDINLCVGIGKNKERKKIYLNGGLSTMIDTYVDHNSVWGEREILVTTLADICYHYVGNSQDIHLLKIDVEGMEGEVIESMDWDRYAPWVLCVEATLPNSDIPCYQDWEPYLLEKGYKFVFQYSVDRYYVHRNKEELTEKFMSIDKLFSEYYVFHAEVRRY